MKIVHVTFTTLAFQRFQPMRKHYNRAFVFSLSNDTVVCVLDNFVAISVFHTLQRNENLIVLVLEKVEEVEYILENSVNRKEVQCIPIIY